jgi:hypothetical protein
MAFFDKLLQHAETLKQFAKIQKDIREHPCPHLVKAILNAAHRAAESLRPIAGMDGTAIKKEDFLRYEMLFSELLYFYMHITLRLAHGQGFTFSDIEKLQNEVFPHIIEGTVEGPVGHWPEEMKEKIKREHCENVNSAEFQYAHCKGVYPTNDPCAMGNSVYATLARNIEQRLGKDHDLFLSLTIIKTVSEKMCELEFSKLITAMRNVL